MMRNHPQSSLPPGFRFHPTDEELILHYLRKRIASSPLPVSIISEVDIYKFDPWDLPAIAPFGEKEWYFFTPRDRKYPNGARPNRAAASGYWKATGTDKTIMTSSVTGGQQNVGLKKALVFYKGRPSKGTKTNWIMHEYRMAEALHHQRNNHNNHNSATMPKDSSMRLDDWVLCRIYKKSHISTPHISTPAITSSTSGVSDQEQEEEEFFQQSLNILPNLKSPPPSNNNNMNAPIFPQKSSSFSNLLDAMDYSLLSSFLSENNTNLNHPGFDSSHFEPPFFNNIINRASNSNYFVDKLPGLSSSSPTTEISAKRENQTVGYDQETANQSKKMKIGDSFTSNSQTELYMPQYLAKKPFLNQQLLTSPYDNLRFQ